MEPTYERAVELMEAPLGDDLVGLEVSRGECFGFNSVAAEVWKRLPASLEDLTRALLVNYEIDVETCRADLAEALETMVQLGLVRRRS